ncbi:methyltransferase domain-containing protein, partial [Patescibacteria group bacterium]
MPKESKVITDQEHFFNINSVKSKDNLNTKLFYDYVNKEQVRGFNWISKAKTILEYGCGTGTSLDLFLKDRNKNSLNIIGVDIAKNAIKQAQLKYPT